MTAPDKPQGAPDVPVTPQKTGAVQGCPNKAKPPCDVTKFVVKATVTTTPPVVRQLTTTCHPYGEVPPIEAKSPDELVETSKRNAEARARVTAKLLEAMQYDPAVPEMLLKYDLIIDTVADYLNSDAQTPTEPAQRVQIESSCQLKPEPCLAHKHPWMKRTAVHSSDPRDSDAPLKKKQLPMHEYVAQSSRLWDRFTPSGDVSALFSVLTSMMAASEPPKHVEILADSCGVPASGTRNGQLLGLVRIFRNETWTVKVTIPPLFKAIEERKRTFEILSKKDEKARSSSQQKLMSGRVFTHSESEEPLAPGVNVVTTKGTGVVVKNGELAAHALTTKKLGDDKAHALYAKTTQGGETFSSDGIPLTDLKEPVLPEGFNVVVTHNTRKVDARKLILAINEIIAFARKAQKLLDFLKVVPQLGWKVTGSIDVMHGDITFRWSPTMVPKSVAGGRYLPVKWDFYLDLEVVLFDFSFTVSFGFEVTIGPKEMQTGAAVKVEGALGLTVPLKRTVTDLDATIALTPTATCSLTPQVYVTVLGWTVFDARIGVKGGLELPDGKVVIDHGIKLKGTIRLSKTLVAGSITSPLGDTYLWQHTVVEDGPLYPLG